MERRLLDFGRIVRGACSVHTTYASYKRKGNEDIKPQEECMHMLTVCIFKLVGMGWSWCLWRCTTRGGRDNNDNGDSQ